MSDPDVIVVGGGISGLVAAWQLLRDGSEPLLLEASPTVGGVIRTERVDGYLLELGPNTVRSSAPLIALCDELGIGDRVLAANANARRRYVARGGRLHRLPGGPLSLLGCGLWSLRGRLALLGEPLRRAGWREGESVTDFFTRRLGRELTDYAVEPFVGGTYAGNPDRLEAESAFRALVGWEREHGSLLRGAWRTRGQRVRPRVRGLVSFPEGLSELPDALRAGLGDRLRCGALVTGVRRDGAGWQVETAAGEAFGAGRLILAVGAPVVGGLLAGIAPELARGLAGVRYAGVALVQLGLAAEGFDLLPDGFGYLNPRREERSVLGVLFPSVIFDGRAPEGRLLATAFIGGDRQPELVERPDDELIGWVVEELSHHFGFSGEPSLARVARHPAAIPQYGSGHAELERQMAQMERSMPGLTLIGSYRGGVSVPDCLNNARHLVVG